MPVDECTGIKQSGAISLGGTANQKANGANNNYNGSNIGSEFLDSKHLFSITIPESPISNSAITCGTKFTSDTSF